MIQALKHIEVVTLFVPDFHASKVFYTDVFGQTVVNEDGVSAVMQFGSMMINLLAGTEAPELVELRTIATVGAGPSA